MSKSATKYVVKIQNAQTLGGLHIVENREPTDEYVATVTGSPSSVPVTRDHLVCIRDQIDRWLDTHPPPRKERQGDEG